MNVTINHKRTLKTNMLTILLVLAMIVPSGLTAAEEIDVDIVDGYENTASDHSTYSVDVSFDSSQVGDVVEFEVGVEVESFPSANENNPEGNKNNRLNKVEISLSEGMELVKTQDVNSNDTTVQYQIFDKDNNQSSKVWEISYPQIVNPGEQTVIGAQAKTEDDRLSLFERIVFLFKAIVNDAENEITFKGEREPGGNPNDATGHQFKLVSNESEDPEQEDPEQEDPEQEDPEQEDPEQEDPEQEDPEQEDPEGEEPEGEAPEIVLQSFPELPDFPELPEITGDGTTPVAEVDDTEELVIALLDPEAPELQPDEELSAAVSAQNLSMLWLLLLLIPGLLWFLLARLVLVRVPNEKGELKTVARKIARYKEKRWFVDVEKQLNKYLAKHGEVFIDFRGGLIKEAKKAVFSGEELLSTGEVRFALVNRQQVVSWLEKLQEKASKVA